MEPFLRNMTNVSKFNTRVHKTETNSSVDDTVIRGGSQLACLSDGNPLVGQKRTNARVRMALLGVDGMAAEGRHID